MPRPEQDAEKYPNCTKLAANRDEQMNVFRFLEWLQEHGYTLAERGRGELVPASKSEDRLWFEYIEIDPVALENERRAILDEQRKANARMPNDIECGCDDPECG